MTKFLLSAALAAAFVAPAGKIYVCVLASMWPTYHSSSPSSQVEARTRCLFFLFFNINEEEEERVEATAQKAVAICLVETIILSSG